MTLHELNTLDKRQLIDELTKMLCSSVWVNKCFPFSADDLGGTFGRCRRAMV